MRTANLAVHSLGAHSALYPHRADNTVRSGDHPTVGDGVGLDMGLTAESVIDCGGRIDVRLSGGWAALYDLAVVADGFYSRFHHLVCGLEHTTYFVG